VSQRRAVAEYVLEELRLFRTSRKLSQEEFGKAIDHSGSRVSSPGKVGVYAGLQGGFILATLPDQSVAAHLDHQVRAQIVDRAEDLATLEGTWEAIRSEALPRTQSLELIREAAKEWK
jgi:hypothetical protein